MNNITLNKKSLHYRLATAYGGLWYGENGTDFCTYLRHVVKGFIFAVLAIVTGSLIAFPLLFFSVWLIAGLFVGAFAPPDAAVVLAAMYPIFVLIVFLGYAISKMREAIQSKMEDKRAPGFWTLVYRKFHDKVCFGINFKD